jgi:hypothetical protein
MEALAQTDNVRDDATVSQFIPLLARCRNLFGFVGKGHRWFAIFENDVNSCGTRPWKVSGVRDVDDNQPIDGTGVVRGVLQGHLAGHGVAE